MGRRGWIKAGLMLAVLAGAVCLAPVAHADPATHLVRAPGVEVLASPDPASEIVALLPAGAHVWVREAAGPLVRIDAAGISGAKFVPLAALRLRPVTAGPPPGPLGCLCRRDRDSALALCGARSAEARRGGVTPQCGQRR